MQCRIFTGAYSPLCIKLNFHYLWSFNFSASFGKCICTKSNDIFLVSSNVVHVTHRIPSILWKYFPLMCIGCKWINKGQGYRWSTEYLHMKLWTGTYISLNLLKIIFLSVKGEFGKSFSIYVILVWKDSETSRSNQKSSSYTHIRFAVDDDF